MTTNKWIAVAVGIALVAFFLYGNSIIGFLNTNNQEVMNENTTSGVGIEDVVIGQGEEAQVGDSVTVNYTGTLTNGQVFDSSIGRAPFTFTIGEGSVIRGWEEGVPGMKVGGKRRLTISPDYGYGANAVGPIPANSTLIFDIELLSVEKGTTTPGVSE